MSIDIEALANGIVDTLADIVRTDFEHHADFARKQTKALAKQAAWIASTATIPFGRAGGFDDREEMNWFLSNLESMAANFARTMAALTVLTLERAWNAIVGAIWGAINEVVTPILGVAIPVPGATV